MRNTKKSLVILITATAAAMGGCSSDDTSTSTNGAGTVGSSTGGADSGNVTGGSTGLATGTTGTGGGTSGEGGVASTGTSGSTNIEAGSDQMPPMGRESIEAWLATGAYKHWHCETSVHMARDPSPHGYNRICSNDAIASHVTWPSGAAAVKEIHADPAEAGAGDMPIGYAVYLKTEAESAGGSNWYWYERIGGTLYADGFGKASADGGDNPANTICVGCHVAAGTPSHVTSAGSSDQVYTPVAAPALGGDAEIDQMPPMGAANVEAWLATGEYKNWHCESAVHMARDPSPHGFNRICSNDVIAKQVNWPAGAAAVKELYAGPVEAGSQATPVGYAVYMKTDQDSAGGANWYWYERVPADSPVPHDSNGVVADGFGAAGDGGNPAFNICVNCHSAAGTAGHTTSPGSRDQVYTPVP